MSKLINKEIKSEEFENKEIKDEERKYGEVNNEEIIIEVINNQEPKLIEILEDAVANFGEESQEGAKFALKECQEKFGCVSVSDQKQIAGALELDEKIIKTIIKFMPSIKESKVEYEIVCCTGPRCAKKGSMEVIKMLKEMTGVDFTENSKDARMSLRSQNCFKKCKFGPNIMINGKLYHHMNKNKVKDVFGEILK